MSIRHDRIPLIGVQLPHSVSQFILTLNTDEGLAHLERLGPVDLGRPLAKAGYHLGEKTRSSNSTGSVERRSRTCHCISQ